MYTLCLTCHYYSPNVHKGKWSKHEDHALTEAVHYYQTITSSMTLPWNRIAENIPHRTGIQCQARWTEALDPAVRKGRWHPEEDKQLDIAIAKYGCCWIRVASMIPTRTQRQCRTRWNQIHSQQLKTSSVSRSNSLKHTSSTTATAKATAAPPFSFEFVPSLMTEQQQQQHQQQHPLVNNDPFIVISTSPTIDDIIAGSNAHNFSSDASTSSSSSSYSSIPDASPTSVIFPISPSTSSTSLLQHENTLFPAMKSSTQMGDSRISNSNGNSTSAAFLDTCDFEFLLDCYTTQ